MDGVYSCMTSPTDYFAKESTTTEKMGMKVTHISGKIRTGESQQVLDRSA